MTDESFIDHHPVIIIGSGIAGWTAAIYAARGNNDPLVLRGDEPGGQLTLTTEVANFPGFDAGISGPDLVNRMEEQAAQFGATVANGTVADVQTDNQLFRIDLANGDQYTADAVIVASGASARTLGVPGEQDLMGYGVSTCATCDGAFFRGEDMVVVGGGDAAFEEASFLTKFAETVHLIHRREGFSAEEHWVDHVHDEHVANGDVVVHQNTEVSEIHGSPEEGIDSVTLIENPDGYPSEKVDASETVERELDVGAVFVAIGHTPNTGYLESTPVELDETGYVQTAAGVGGGETATAVDGVFAAGDVVDFQYQQAVTAAGMGCKAALDADAYLTEE